LVNVFQRQKHDTDSELEKFRKRIQDIDNSVRNLVKVKLTNEVKRKVESLGDTVIQQLREVRESGCLHREYFT